jgi:hypothetical protein
VSIITIIFYSIGIDMHNSRSTHRQKGLGFFGFIGAIVLFGGLFVAVTAVVPTYL